MPYKAFINEKEAVMWKITIFIGTADTEHGCLIN